MSATITTFSGDKRIQLANSEMLRRPIILNNWTIIRIGLRFCFPSAATILGTPNLTVGMGSGLTNGIGDATTTNFIGATTFATSWTITAGPPAYGTCNLVKTRKKVATTVTDGVSGTVVPLFSFGQAVLNAYIIEVTKGSPNYTVNIIAPTTATAAQTNVTQAQMVQIMEAAVGAAQTTASGLIAGYNQGSAAVAMTEVAGNLDCIQVYWDRTSVNCEISDVFYRKVS